MSRADDKRFALAVEREVIGLAANSGYRLVESYLSADGLEVKFRFRPFGKKAGRDD